MPTINARQIEAFRAIMLSGSVTGAARLLNISQPSVSRLLAQLESTVGFKLFAPQGRGLVSTPEAGEFFKEVERYFSGLSELEVAANNIRHFSQSRLVVGNIAATALDVMPSVVSRLRKTHPNVSYDFRVRSTFQILEWCRSAKIDVGIISPESNVTGVEVAYDRKFSYTALLPENHPLSSRSGPLQAEDLSGEVLIAPFPSNLAMRTENPDVRRLLIEGTSVSVEVSSAAATMVQTGIGVAIVDPFTARYFCRMGGIIQKPLVGAPSYSFTVVMPVIPSQSNFLSVFTNVLVDWLDEAENDFVS